MLIKHLSAMFSIWIFCLATKKLQFEMPVRKAFLVDSSKIGHWFRSISD